MADLCQVIVLFVCVIAFVLLTMACAGNSWVVAYDDSSSAGLWKFCESESLKCVSLSDLGTTKPWYDGVRALSVISVLIAAFISLACLAVFFFEDHGIISYVGHPLICAGLLVVTGNIITNFFFHTYLFLFGIFRL